MRDVIEAALLAAGRCTDRFTVYNVATDYITVTEIAEAVLYLTEAQTVTGEVLHVDGGAHSGKW